MDFSAPVSLRAIERFHIAGRSLTVSGQVTTTLDTVPGLPARVSDPNGTYQVGQLYAQYFRLTEPRYTRPLLLWHGGGMTGCTWEAGPTGQAGWHDLFMQAGWDTCVSDAPGRGRAGWAPYPLITPDQPEHRTLEQAWTIFRLGPPEGYATQRVFAGQQFALEDLPGLGCQFVARWPSYAEQTIQAYLQLLEKLDQPVAIVAHSEGARYAMEVAARAPARVGALVLVEPAGTPDLALLTPDTLRALRSVPQLVVWGDHFAQSPLWQNYRKAAMSWLDTVRDAGAPVDVLDLPALGVMGNSHLPMMDRNAHDVAARVQAWLHRHGQPRDDAGGPKPEARSPKPEARSPKPEARSPKP